MSVGLRRVADGFDFIWRGSKNEKPHLVSPNGKVIELEVRDYVPYLCSKSQHPNVSAVASSNHVENPMPRVKVMASSSRPNETHDEDDEPSLHFSPGDDEDYDDDEPAIVGGSASKHNDDDLVPDISGDPEADAPTDVEEGLHADREVQPDDGEIQERGPHHDPASTRAEERAKEKAKKRGRASMAKVHREV